MNSPANGRLRLAAGMAWMRRRAVVFAGLLLMLASAPSFAALTITPITWNVIGLDSNKVSDGPDTFPVGARVCNVSGTASAPVTATFVRTGPTNSFLTLLTPGPLSSGGPLPAGGAPPSQYTISAKPANCFDFYFNIRITRSNSAWNTLQGFRISATNGTETVLTPANRELFVEKLISQNRNGVDSFSGPATLYVGQTAVYTVNGHTATAGYEQVEFAPVLPVLFQMTDVSVSMAVPTGGVNSSVYADACGWENNPSSPDYWRKNPSNECHNPDQYVGGQAGGSPVSLTYTVKAITAGSGTMTNVWYDFSGSSFHYNNDVGTGINSLPFTILAASPITGTKSFSPATIGPGGGNTSTMTITLNNPNVAPSQGGAGIPDVAFTDTFPTSPGAMTLANTSTTNSCGGTLTDDSGGTLGAGDTGIRLAGGTIPWSGSCTITVVVTASTPGLYTNTIPVGGVTTSYGGSSSNASAISGALAVVPGYKSVTVPVGGDADGSGTPTVGDTLTWSVFYNNPANPVGNTAVPSFQVMDTVGAGMTVVGAPTVTYTPAACSSGTANGTFDGAGSNNLFAGAFTLSEDCTVRVDYNTTVTSAAGGTTLSNQASGSGTGLAAVLTDNIDGTTSGLPTGVSPTAGSIAQTQGATIDPTTVAIPIPPTVTKSFSPDPVGTNQTTSLTIELFNSNAFDLTSTTFTDTFPTAPGQMVVATPLNVSSNTCGGTLRNLADDADLAAGDLGIRLIGGTIPASGSCVVEVDVSADTVGNYTNTILAGDLVTSGGSSQADASDTLAVNPPLTILKSSNVISDPTGSANPKAIPGAVVEYTVLVTVTGAVDATSVVVTDPIPANTTYIDNTLIADGVACPDDDYPGPGPATGSCTAFGGISANLGTITAGNAKAVVFRVTVN